MKKTLHLFAIACISLLALPAAAQIPAYVPTDGLVGWWPFNGNANDESGNGNDGVVNGATLIEDRFGITDKSYSFNGETDFIEINNAILNQINNLNAASVSYWFNTIESEQGAIWGHHSNSFGAVGYNPGFVSGAYDGTIAAANSTGCCAFFSEQVTPYSEWHNATIVFDSNQPYESQIKIFIDGVHNTSISGTPNNSSGNGTSIFIGRRNTDYDTYGDYFYGLLDDFGAWNRALSESEILSLYTGECPTVATNCTSLPSNLQQGLVGYWPFCGNANDESGNGNDGTVNGAILTEDRFGNAGKAYSFDGGSNNNANNIVMNNPLDTNQGFSINYWMNPANTTNPSWHLMISDLEDSNLEIVTANDSILFQNFIGSLGYSIVTLKRPLNSTAGSQHNYCWTYDGANLNLYIDGQFDANLSFQNLVVPVGGSMILGKHFFFNDFQDVAYEGSLDDIGIWNRALTPEEVQELYTLDACTFTVYDTSYVTVYDTLTTYETVYDTIYTYETIYDTVTTYVTVTDTLLIDITFTGFEGQPSWLNTVTVFPNPASDHITIDYGNFALMAGYNTVITDAAGATVYSSAVNSQQAYIDINAWGAAGVYYMTIYDASGAAVAVRHIVLE